LDTVDYNKNRIERLGELAERLEWEGDLSLLRQALTHPTYFEGQKSAEDHDNQRLEFLGDSIVGFIVARELFERNPQSDEGYLSKTRANLVCEGSLAELARELCLGDYIVMGKGSLKNGEQNRNSILADAFEAVVGAMYLSQGLAKVEKFLLARFTPELEAKVSDLYEDYKGLIQMLVQTLEERHVSYPLLSADGPSHQRTFTVGLVYRGKTLATASGSSKKEAEQRAARIAWQNQSEWLPNGKAPSKK
jgi:ribonuclease-3